MKTSAFLVLIGLAASFGMAPAHHAQAYACNARHYTNVDHISVHSPSCKSSNYTAICRDGSYSHSLHHRGTCSRHGGVRSWK